MEDDKSNERQALLMMGVILMGGLAVGATAREALVPDATEAQARLRIVLKDPKKTDKLIESLSSQLVTKEFLDDPEVMKNLRRLTAAVEGHVQESLDERLKALHEKKELLKDTNAGNWTEKAVKPKGGDGITERGY